MGEEEEDIKEHDRRERQGVHNLEVNKQTYRLPLPVASGKVSQDLLQQADLCQS